MQHDERELTEPVFLCDTKGLLNPESIGFARSPLVTSNIKGHLFKKKRWNHWAVYGEDLLVSVTIIHLDRFAACYVYILDYETQRFYEKYIKLPFGRRLKMPEHPLDSIKFVHEELTVQIIHLQDETHLSIAVPNFDNEMLHADLHIAHPDGDETLNVVIPKSRDAFHFTSKHAILPAGGFLKVGSRRYDFNPYYSFAIYDYARGVRSHTSDWNWAAASQRTGGKRIGLNFGGDWTDGLGITENAVFVEGMMHKFHEDVLFTRTDGTAASYWQIQTKFSDDISLKFTPFFRQHTERQFFAKKLNLYHMVGYYQGKIRLPDGQMLPVRQLLGSLLERKYQ